ncbi:MAG: alpha/beta hydrolase [Bacteroidetes bacterium]|nr:alpha/beta hydrolase [Bacteroidota bacterium]
MTKTDIIVSKLLKKWAETPEIDLSKLTVEVVRESDKNVQQLQEPLEPVGNIEEYTVPTLDGEILMKIYIPKSCLNNNTNPVFIFFHGGGFVIDGESYESPIRKIANDAKCIICAVEYSLAPEYKFPRAVDESISATQWIFENVNLFGGDPNRIAIGGDSSGGNLATVVILNNKERYSFKGLILIYPMLDATCSQPSINQFGDGYGFTKEKIDWYFNQYLPPNANRTNINISPFFAKEELLKYFPPTFIATAECDPIRDEGEIFAQKLKKSGIDVRIKRYQGMIHGFFQMSGVLNKGKTLIKDISKELSIYLSIKL